ncbi:MAG: aminodeoxychorismate synthase component I [Bacteroidales bacterium]|nr:aminodeoxychorismate synthase component I [Bacteroidales bacterium]
MNKKDAISHMNKLGSSKTPFLFIVDYEMENSHIWPLNEVPESVKYQLNDITNEDTSPIPNKTIQLTYKPIPFSIYQEGYNKVQQHLKAGNSYLVNLTFQTEIKTNYSLDEIFRVSVAPYKLKFKNKFVVFSPEKFMRIDNNIISTFPMKGTIDASVPNAEEKLLKSVKESSEHATIVDLLRNDLSLIATDVKVDKYRYTEKIKTTQNEIIQVSSEITGNLQPGWHKNIGTILFTMLPAGSISGAPKPKTLEIISEAENYKRGYYTGIFGVYNGNKVESAVMIRYIEQNNDIFIYKSGGGITALSNIEEEYNELNQKIYVPVS